MVGGDGFEYFPGEAGSRRFDMFSLGVIADQMLSGKLPYGAKLAQAAPGHGSAKLGYRSAR
jgi:hypothetical protein